MRKYSYTNMRSSMELLKLKYVKRGIIFVAMRHREMSIEDQIVAVESCEKKTIQMIAIDKGNAILIYHATTPPKKGVPKDLGLN